MPTNRENNDDLDISLIVPIKNESDSLENLVESINRQVFKPAEIIFVDGGSTDDTLKIAKKLLSGDSRFKIIKTPEASPGKGRNIGAENARFGWIAFTDAGIELDKHWLEKLAEIVKDDAEIDMVYGNFSPAVDSLFEKCAMLAYVPPQSKDGIRDKSIASTLLKKEVWEKVGGFPDLRAAEDLIFIEAVEKNDFKIGYAPEAMIYWKLSPNFVGTFRKFTLYSKHNALIGRQWDWHYGVARQYFLFILIFILAFINSWWWLLVIVFWFVARTARNILSHRYESGLSSLFNPVIFLGTALVIFTIDMATFVGWVQATLSKKN